MAFLILHGLENHRPPQHWEFLLAAALVERGHAVSYPGLPEPDAPRLDDWIAVLDRELGDLGGRPAVVCHSLGCLLWMHASARGGGRLAERVLLVAPPASDALPDTAASFRIDRLDADAILESAGGEITVVSSDADPYNPAGAQRLYCDPLGIAATVIPGAGHISVDDGFGPWPFALEWCEG